MLGLIRHFARLERKRPQQEHMRVNGLFPELQSTYHQHHSTETALLKVKNDLQLAMDKGQVTLLLLLDLSSALNTVEHEILLERLRSTIGLRGKVLSWFESYLKGRSQLVSINGTLSKPFDLKCGDPQGSCLGPLLFTIYVNKLFQILKHHLPSVHTYADDTQLYLSFKPSDSSSEVEAVSALQKCICDVRAGMRQDQLMLNDDKTEFLIIGTRQQLSKVSIQSMMIGQTEVSPVASARNLGTWFNTHLDMGTHITKTCSSALYYLYNLRHIRKYLSRESTEKLVHAFISSRLDYCNSLLYGILEYQIIKLQRVMNASARLIYRVHKFCHITPLLAELHWLPVRSKIHYKILLTTFKILHGLSPKYLLNLISIQQPSSYYLRRNDNGCLLERPSVKTKKTLGDRAFQVAAPFLWNKLPRSACEATSLESVKILIKTFLFKESFQLSSYVNIYMILIERFVKFSY